MGKKSISTKKSEVNITSANDKSNHGSVKSKNRSEKACRPIPRKKSIKSEASAPDDKKGNSSFTDMEMKISKRKSQSLTEQSLKKSDETKAVRAQDRHSRNSTSLETASQPKLQRKRQTIKIEENQMASPSTSGDTKIKSRFDEIAELLRKESEISNNKEDAKRVIHQKSDESCTDSEDSDDWQEVPEAHMLETPAEGVAITLETGGSLAKRRKKKEDFNVYLRRHVNRFRRVLQLNLHRTHVLCLFAHQMYLNNLLRSTDLQALALSVIPAVMNSPKKKPQLKTTSSVNVKQFISLMRSQYRIQDESFPAFYECGKLCETIARIFETSSAPNLTYYAFALLIILRAMCLPSRLVMSYHPLPRIAAVLLKAETQEKSDDVSHPKSPSDKKCSEDQIDKVPTTKRKTSKARSSASARSRETQSDSESDSDTNSVNRNNKRPKKSVSKNKKRSSVNAKKAAGCGSSDEEFTPPAKSISKRAKKEVDEGKRNIDDTEPYPFYVWIEVYSEDGKQYYAIDFTCDKYSECATIAAKIGRPMTYVVAADESGYMCDVTEKYASDWLTRVKKERGITNDWFDPIVEKYAPPSSDQKRKVELERIHEMHAKKPMPTRISDFKNHPVYALQRHLLKFEAIFPPDAPPLGFVSAGKKADKEAVYARECVHTLRSRDTWLKEARQIRIGEEPYRIVKARPKYDRVTGTFIRDLPLEVFGEWQTEPYQPEIAHDGKVPRNDFGNVYLFKECMLPIGTVRLRLPGLNRVAKKLNIDCAPAVVGFEGFCHGVRPLFDGFVVCEEFRNTLQLAWCEEQANLEAKDELKRRQRIYDNWRRLVKGLLVQRKIRTKYLLQSQRSYLGGKRNDDGKDDLADESEDSLSDAENNSKPRKPAIISAPITDMTLDSTGAIKKTKKVESKPSDSAVSKKSTGNNTNKRTLSRSKQPTKKKKTNPPKKNAVVSGNDDYNNDDNDDFKVRRRVTRSSSGLISASSKEIKKEEVASDSEMEDVGSEDGDPTYKEDVRKSSSSSSDDDCHVVVDDENKSEVKVDKKKNLYQEAGISAVAVTKTTLFDTTTECCLSSESSNED